MFKKLLIICPEFKDEFIRNQPWRQIHELAKRLHKKNIHVAIATESTEKINDSNIEILYLSQKHIRTLNPQSMKKISNFSPDLILWIGNPYSGFYLKKLKIDIPIILYVSSMHMMYQELKNLSFIEIFSSHFLQLLTAFFPFKKIVKNLNTKKICKIIVANETIKNRLIELNVNSNKILTSPLFFEMEETNQSTPSDNNSLFTICYFGPPDTIRGTDILLKSISLLKKKKIRVHLKLLLREKNESVYKVFYSKCKKLGIEKNTNIVTKILSHHELMNQIQSCDVIVIPTKFVWNEPPLAILESMQLGLPLVTTNVCGLKELVQNNAFTVDPTSNSLCDIFSKLISDPDLGKKIGMQGKKYVLSLSNWNDMTDWFLDELTKTWKKYNENQK